MRKLLNLDDPTPIETINKKSNADYECTQASNEPGQHENLIKCNDSQLTNKNKRKLTPEEVEEIHSKIVNHLSNLNNSRKRSIINSQNSGFDSTIEHVAKQNRIAIARAFRHMYSSYVDEDDIVNSVIPDSGIDMQKLPPEIIKLISENLEEYDFNVDTAMNSSNIGRFLCTYVKMTKFNYLY